MQDLTTRRTGPSQTPVKRGSKSVIFVPSSIADKNNTPLPPFASNAGNAGIAGTRRIGLSRPGAVWGNLNTNTRAGSIAQTPPSPLQR